MNILLLSIDLTLPDTRLRLRIHAGAIAAVVLLACLVFGVS